MAKLTGAQYQLCWKDAFNVPKEFRKSLLRQLNLKRNIIDITGECSRNLNVSRSLNI